MDYPLPENEEHRLEVLTELNILDSEDEEQFDRITQAAQRIFNAEKSAITLVDAHRQWYKSKCGVERAEINREDSICTHTILDDDVLVVQNPREDPRFSNITSVQEGKLGFYAGAPLRIEEDVRIGALCVFGEEPQPFGQQDRALLQLLADVVADMIKTRHTAHKVQFLTSALENANDAVVITEGKPLDPPGPRIIWVNDAFSEMTGYSSAEVIGKSPRLLQGEETSREELDKVRHALEEEQSVQAEVVNYKKDGTPFLSAWNLSPVHDGDDKLTHWVAVQRDLTESRKREDRLLYEATHDSLTGLYNRAKIEKLIEQVIENGSSEAHPHPHALLYLDLDNFKLVNDTLGHRKGDILLKKVAEFLQSETRNTDAIARVGGDEFAIYLPDAGEKAEAIAERISDALDKPIDLGERQTAYTPASIGSVVGLSDYDDVGAVFRDADIAMYEAKSTPARDPVTYNPSMSFAIQKEFELTARLREAIDNHEFEPYFQPILNLEEGTIHSFEVLARWHSPEKGVLTPGEFIDVAEKAGLLVQISHQVFEKACETLSVCQEKHSDMLKMCMSANFAREEFFIPETRALIEDILQKNNISAHRLTMEITERLVDDEQEQSFQVFRQLRKMGVSIVLDDFGTGYSSIQALQHLPVDGLKIDKEFVGNLNNESGEKLVDAIMGLARSFEKRITAEGIETERQLTILRKKGCRFGQGYLFSKPVSSTDAKELIANTPWKQYWR